MHVDSVSCFRQISNIVSLDVSFRCLIMRTSLAYAHKVPRVVQLGGKKN